MRKAAAAFLLAFAAVPVFAQEEPGFEALSGIPLMEGLAEAPDSLIVFDKAEGRIIQADLTGNAPLEDALAFYRESLFQLGWRLVRDEPVAAKRTLTFNREGEELVAEFSEGPPLMVHFRLGPSA